MGWSGGIRRNDETFGFFFSFFFFVFLYLSKGTNRLTMIYLVFRKAGRYFSVNSIKERTSACSYHQQEERRHEAGRRV